MKYISLTILTFIAVNLSALQIIIDSWATVNEWTGKAANGASANFYMSETFSGVDGASVLFEAGGNNAPNGQADFYTVKPSSDGFDGWGTINTSFAAWNRTLDTSLGAPINGNNQMMKMGNSGNQNRFDFQIENTGSETISLDSIGIMARNNFSANHPTTFTISHLQKGQQQGAVYLNELETDGVRVINAQPGTARTTLQIGDSVVYTGNEAKWVERSFTNTTLASGAKASFRLEMSGNNGGTGTAQTHFDTLTINVSAVPVPEPSTYALLLGFISFLFIAIKQRK